MMIPIDNSQWVASDKIVTVRLGSSPTMSRIPMLYIYLQDGRERQALDGYIDIVMKALGIK